MSELVEKGLKAQRESKSVDFKGSFNPASNGEWCELIKDIVAMANSVGGVILIGLSNNGKPSGEDVAPVLAIDHATFVDKIRKYTLLEFSEIEVHEAIKDGHRIAVIEISGVQVPMVFQRVGTYKISDNKQKAAFSHGTVYFRHGAKSEPGTTDDLRKVIERNLDVVRKEWLSGVQKVVKAPTGSVVTVFKGEVRESSDPGAVPIRLVDDPDAPGYRLVDHDMTYPYRQKELVNVINAMLPDGIDINSYDILCVRRIHNVDGDHRFCHQPKFASPQYSDAFAKWVVESHKEDTGFFERARSQYYKQTHGSEG